MNKIKCTLKSKNYKRNWEILSLGYRYRKCPIFGQLSLAGYAQSFVTGELKTNNIFVDWCGDCITAEPIILEEMGNVPSNSIFVHVDIGMPSLL